MDLSLQFPLNTTDSSILPCPQPTDGTIESSSKDEKKQKITLANMFDTDGFNDHCGVSLTDAFSFLETEDDARVPKLDICEELIALPETTKVASEKANSTPVMEDKLPLKRKAINTNLCKVLSNFIFLYF